MRKAKQVIKVHWPPLVFLVVLYAWTLFVLIRIAT